MKPDIFLSGTGAGPGITYMAGAAAAVRKTFNVRGTGGPSAFALVSAAIAFGKDDYTILETLKQALTQGALLKPDPMAIARGGVLDWEVLGDFVDKVIGKGKRMKDAAIDLVICVTDLDTRRPLYISKQTHPDVSVRQAVMASSAFMAFATPACRIPSLGSPLSPDVRLFVDGGWTDNTVDAVWDRRTDPRILLRLKPDDNVRRIREGDVAGIHGAVLSSALWASSQPKSHRTDGLVVDVDGHNDWAFLKDVGRIDAEWQRGYDSTIAACEAWLLTKTSDL